MKRRDFMVAASGLALAGLTALGSRERAQAEARPAPEAPKPLNYLFILTDDMGWGDMGCFGHPVIQTPNLDRLAAQSCRLTNYYVSTPVCAPSRAGFMTGRDPNRYGMKFLCNDGRMDAPIYHHVPREEPMLPRLLKEAGYRTGHIGKWHLSLLDYVELGVPGPRDFGIDDSLTLEPKGSGLYKNPSNWTRNGQIVKGKLADWVPELCVNESIRFIRECKGRPFFLNVWPFTPHEDIVTAQKFKDLYPDLTEEERTYFGCLTQLDNELGRLFRFLEEEKLMERTVIVFTSDNGPEHPLLPWAKMSRGSTGQGRGSKHNLYEGGIRVPAIVRWPGLTQPGSVSHEPVSGLDLVPTFCAASGVALPAGVSFDGGDFRPALVKKSVARPHPLYWQYERVRDGQKRGATFGSPPLALREGRWKLLCEEGGRNPELYNLYVDQGEKWNLAAHHPEVVQRLTSALLTIYREVNGPAARAAKYLNPAVPKREIPKRKQ